MITETEPLEVKFLGDNLIQVDGVRMTLEVIKSAMNPNEFSQRNLFSVKRIDDKLEFQSYYNMTECEEFFKQFITKEEA